MWGCLLYAGCEIPSAQPDSHYERVSREIEQLKETLAIGDNIKVEVNFLSVSAQNRTAVDTVWRYADKNIAIINRPDVYARSGLQIGVGGDNFRARLNLVKEQVTTSEDTEIFLVLADGTTGFISIGQEIAVPKFYYYGRWYSAVGYQFRRAGRLLEVSVRKLPSGLIEMELTPVFSNFLNDSGDLKLTELSTRVAVRPGQTVVIGGSDSTEENVAAALLGYHQMGQLKHTLITVTPYAEF